MIRVVVADDENRICKLIMKLIQWDDIGMTIVGTANNGVETLELIKKEKPDIVITDIRMPGYDGLDMIERAKKINKDVEFIIISGYSHFEYAKRAIGYGVKDYLLKPINKEELLNALLRVKGDLLKKKGYMNLENEYKDYLKNDGNIIRKSFLDNLILVDGSNFVQYSLEEINKKYHFYFQPYLFRVVALKLDQTLGKDIQGIRNYMEKILETICLSLQEFIYDIDGVIKNDFAYILMNYREEDNQLIQDELLKILEDFRRKIPKSQNIDLTLGYGEEVREIGSIKVSFDSAKLSIDNRIIEGTNRLIQHNEIKVDKAELKEKFLAFSEVFVKKIKRLDRGGIKEDLSHLKKEISQISIGGRELKTLILDIANIYSLTLKTNNIRIDHETEEYKSLENSVENCLSPECLFDKLWEYIETSLSLLEKNSINKNTVQINQAKEFIEANYMNNITLEDVGNYIGFNPSYFSSIFKKETGTSFVEYLSMVRIEKAKDLLKEPDLKIQDICLMVGYNDVKYFSKLFIKHTGLKPKEYRKIFI